jgi:hypothetical protein
MVWVYGSSGLYLQLTLHVNTYRRNLHINFLTYIVAAFCLRYGKFHESENFFTVITGLVAFSDFAIDPGCGCGAGKGTA